MAPPDELAGPASLRERWDAAPLAARRRLLTGLVGAGALAVLATGLLATGELAERDRVRLTAALEVTASSSSPDGGRVEHGLRLRNEGALPVRLEATTLALPGLRGTPRAGLPADVPAGAQVGVGLSLRLDCTARGAGAPPLRVTVVAVPRSGRRHRLVVPVRAAEPLLAQIGTLCRARPDLVDVELSGPGARS